MRNLTIFRFEDRLYDVDHDSARTQNMIALPDGRLLVVRDWEQIAEDLHKPIVADAGNTIEQFAAEKNQESADAIPVAEAIR